jgi:hypothetical protein
VRLACVPPPQIEQAWGLVGHLIVRAMTHTGMGDAACVYENLIAGQSLLWIAIDGHIAAAAVTELTTAHGRKICTIVACGGDQMQNWLHLIDGLEEYARREGCAATRIIGRRGWLRRLPAYRQKAVIMERAF